MTKLERPRGRFARIEVADLRAALAVEGRPVLPSESALLGCAGDDASVHVIEETARDLSEVEGLELEPLGKTEFRPDGKGLTPVAFYRDRVLRRRPLVARGDRRARRARHMAASAGRAAARQPFRVDPVSHAVRAVTAATIRVDFVREGGTGAARTQSLLDGAPALPAPADAWEGLYRRGILNYEAARTFRTAPPVPARRALPIGTEGTGARTSGGFDPAEEWTVKVDTTGVWRVTYAQLSAKGFPLGVSTQALAMTRRTWTGNQTPPFVRVPVPILCARARPARTACSTATMQSSSRAVVHRSRAAERHRRGSPTRTCTTSPSILRWAARSAARRAAEPRESAEAHVVPVVSPLRKRFYSRPIRATRARRISRGPIRSATRRSPIR